MLTAPECEEMEASNAPGGGLSVWVGGGLLGVDLDANWDMIGTCQIFMVPS